ncbi:DUF5666 domain-containing protein [Marinobacter xestospongiae]|uniref:DUF5666 domain-containing protein n=1 Tax=Marinobacter xestospongiae TaxID=994319 RepID=A0ABU3W1B7_9GAMM|nr:DUF5666 domain-containing protein [Marinobacter xestospongiae]MDV2080150.1 DUF5666 domain-containing protein [Marinobacter xestospongiae]
MRRKALAGAVRATLVTMAVTTLVACGSDSDDKPGTDQPGEWDAIGNSVGPVSGFGSVYVNGVRFDTDGVVTSDDGIDREEQLEKGMVLRVNGSWKETGQGEAYEIFYDDLLRGPLTTASWDSEQRTGELKVLGQTVLVDAQTVFKGASVDELKATPEAFQVRISGWYQQEGNFRASFVGAAQLEAIFDEYQDVELEGKISNLDQLAETFNINDQPVSYDLAQFDEDLDETELSNGMLIEVEGTLKENGVFVAKEIERQGDYLAGEEGDDLELSGPVMGEYDAANRRFMLNGFTVQVSDATEFEDGAQEELLTNGVRVSVEGQVSGGVLLAEEIELKMVDAEVEGVIVGIDLSTNTIDVGGVTALISSGSLLENDEDDSQDRLKIDELAVGDLVEISGFQRESDGVGYLEVFKLERESADDDDDQEPFELQGRVTDVTETAITVLSVELLAGDVDISDIETGQKVEAEYVPTEGGQYKLLEVEAIASTED